MAEFGPPIRERAEAALTAHAQLLRAMEQEPARQRDPADSGEAATAWCRWYDEQMQAAWKARDEVLTRLLVHPDYERWNRLVWRDDVTVGSRVPFVWRPVAVAICAAAAR